MRTRVLLELAKRALARHALGIGGELAHRLDISREPGEPVRGALLAVEQPADHAAFDDHPLPHFGDGVAQQGVEGGRGLAREIGQFMVGADGRQRSAWNPRHGERLAGDTKRAVHKSKATDDRPFPAQPDAGQFAENCNNINHFALS